MPPKRKSSKHRAAPPPQRRNTSTSKTIGSATSARRGSQNVHTPPPHEGGAPQQSGRRHSSCAVMSDTFVSSTTGSSFAGFAADEVDTSSVGHESHEPVAPRRRAKTVTPEELQLVLNVAPPPPSDDGKASASASMKGHETSSTDEDAVFLTVPVAAQSADPLSSATREQMRRNQDRYHSLTASEVTTMSRGSTSSAARSSRTNSNSRRETIPSVSDAMLSIRQQELEEDEEDADQAAVASLAAIVGNIPWESSVSLVRALPPSVPPRSSLSQAEDGRESAVSRYLNARASSELLEVAANDGLTARTGGETMRVDEDRTPDEDDHTYPLARTRPGTATGHVAHGRPEISPDLFATASFPNGIPPEPGLGRDTSPPSVDGARALPASTASALPLSSHLTGRTVDGNVSPAASSSSSSSAPLASGGVYTGVPSPPTPRPQLPTALSGDGSANTTSTTSSRSPRGTEIRQLATSSLISGLAPSLMRVPSPPLFVSPVMTPTNASVFSENVGVSPMSLGMFRGTGHTGDGDGSGATHRRSSSPTTAAAHRHHHQSRGSPDLRATQEPREASSPPRGLSLPASAVAAAAAAVPTSPPFVGQSPSMSHLPHATRTAESHLPAAGAVNHTVVTGWHVRGSGNEASVVAESDKLRLDNYLEEQQSFSMVRGAAVVPPVSSPTHTAPQAAPALALPSSSEAPVQPPTRLNTDDWSGATEEAPVQAALSPMSLLEPPEQHALSVPSMALVGSPKDAKAPSPEPHRVDPVAAAAAAAASTSPTSQAEAPLAGATTMTLAQPAASTVKSSSDEDSLPRLSRSASVSFIANLEDDSDAVHVPATDVIAPRTASLLVVRPRSSHKATTPSQEESAVEGAAKDAAQASPGPSPLGAKALLALPTTSVLASNAAPPSKQVARQQALAESFRNRIQVGVKPSHARRSSVRRSRNTDSGGGSGSRSRSGDSGRRSSTSASGGSGSSSSQQRSSGSSSRRRGAAPRRRSTSLHGRNGSASGGGRGSVVPGTHFISVAIIGFFLSRLLAVVKRLREEQYLEAIGRPRAAYAIQCAWRAHKQAERVRRAEAAQFLVPWLRHKLRRLRRAKEASARLLQRVFRGQRDRSFHQFLYERMRYNRALATLRRRVGVWESQSLLQRLKDERDERNILIQQCEQGATRVLREQRHDWALLMREAHTQLHIVHSFTVAEWATMVEERTGFNPLVVEEDEVDEREDGGDGDVTLLSEATASTGDLAPPLSAPDGVVAASAETPHSGLNGSPPGSPSAFNLSPRLPGLVTIVPPSAEDDSAICHARRRQWLARKGGGGGGPSKDDPIGSGPRRGASRASSLSHSRAILSFSGSQSVVASLLVSRTLLGQPETAVAFLNETFRHESARYLDDLFPGVAGRPHRPLHGGNLNGQTFLGATVNSGGTPCYTPSLSQTLHSAAGGDGLQLSSLVSPSADRVLSPTLRDTVEPTARRDPLYSAFVGLLESTEATARRVLQQNLLDQHRSFLLPVSVVNRVVAIHGRVPPLYASLLFSMKDEEFTSRAAELFRQEQQARLSIIAEYEAVPLQSLDRPLLCDDAEARRQRLAHLSRHAAVPLAVYEDEENEFHRKVLKLEQRRQLVSASGGGGSGHFTATSPDGRARAATADAGDEEEDEDGEQRTFKPIATLVPAMKQAHAPPRTRTARRFQVLLSPDAPSVTTAEDAVVMESTLQLSMERHDSVLTALTEEVAASERRRPRGAPMPMLRAEPTQSVVRSYSAGTMNLTPSGGLLEGGGSSTSPRPTTVADAKSTLSPLPPRGSSQARHTSSTGRIPHSRHAPPIPQVQLSADQIDICEEEGGGNYALLCASDAEVPEMDAELSISAGGGGNTAVSAKPPSRRGDSGDVVDGAACETLLSLDDSGVTSHDTDGPRHSAAPPRRTTLAPPPPRLFTAQTAGAECVPRRASVSASLPHVTCTTSTTNSASPMTVTAAEPAVQPPTLRALRQLGLARRASPFDILPDPSPLSAGPVVRKTSVVMASDAVPVPIVGGASRGGAGRPLSASSQSLPAVAAREATEAAMPTRNGHGFRTDRRSSRDQANSEVSAAADTSKESSLTLPVLPVTPSTGLPPLRQVTAFVAFPKDSPTQPPLTPPLHAYSPRPRASDASSAVVRVPSFPRQRTSAVTVATSFEGEDAPPLGERGSIATTAVGRGSVGGSVATALTPRRYGSTNPPTRSQSTTVSDLVGVDHLSMFDSSRDSSAVLGDSFSHDGGGVVGSRKAAPQGTQRAAGGGHAPSPRTRAGDTTRTAVAASMVVPRRPPTPPPRVAHTVGH